MRKKYVRSALLVFAALTPTLADAQVASAFKDAKLTITVASAPGGGYDAYARMIARHLGRYVPGNPSVVIKNLPGAGGNIAANALFAQAQKDGTEIGALTGNSIVDPLFGTNPVKHDPSKFIYLGSANNDVYICALRNDAPVKSFAEAFNKEVIVGGSSSAATAAFPLLMNKVLGTKLRVVQGYEGVQAITLAIEKNEVSGVCGLAWSTLAASNPGWFSSGFVKVVAQLHAVGYPDLNRQGIPLAINSAKTEDARAMLEAFFSQTVVGRPYALPPGTPPDRVAILRKAFADTMADPALVAEAQRLKLDLNPVSGEDVQSLVDKTYAMAPALVAQVKQAISTP